MAFTTAFGAPTGLGTGALQLATNDTNGAKVQLLTTNHAGTRLDDIGELSYWTFRSQGPPEADASYQLEVDVNGAAVGGFTTLVYEPYWNGTVGAGWQHWSSVEDGNWWSSRQINTDGTTGTAGTQWLLAGAGGPPFTTPAAVVAEFPAAVVLRVGVNVGSYNPDYLVAADGLTIAGTTYDFEPGSFTKDACKSGGWETNFSSGQFENQGDCVSYFASGGKTHPAG